MLTVKPKNDNDDIAGQEESSVETPEDVQDEPPAEAETPEEADADVQDETKLEKPDGNSDTTEKEQPKKQKRKRHPVKSLLRVLLALIIIAGGIYLILFVVAWLAKYDSIAAMLESMRIELDLMWQRIRN
jgi:hypothetical protein